MDETYNLMFYGSSETVWFLSFFYMLIFVGIMNKNVKFPIIWQVSGQPERNSNVEGIFVFVKKTLQQVTDYMKNN